MRVRPIGGLYRWTEDNVQTRILKKIRRNHSLSLRGQLIGSSYNNNVAPKVRALKRPKKDAPNERKMTITILVLL